MKKLGSVLMTATVLLAGCAPSIEFSIVQPRPQAPQAIELPGDIALFLRDLGKAYGSQQSKEVENFLASDFLYQGMDRQAYMQHLASNQAYIDKMEIRPLQATKKGEALEVVAYGMMARGPMAPSLQILPLNAGATLVKEAGRWRLRGNQQAQEQGLYLKVVGMSGTFAPPDMAAYRALIPAGWELPEQPLVQLAIVEWQSMVSPQIPYRLAQLNILVSKEGRSAWYYVEMPETDWLAVGAGKAVGYPKYVTDVLIDRVGSDGWQASVKQGDNVLVTAGFSADSAALLQLKEQTRDGVIVVPGGPSLVVYNQPLGEADRPHSQPGWMTVSQAGHGQWQKLLPVGMRVPAVVYEYDKPLKLVIPPLAQIGTH